MRALKNMKMILDEINETVRDGENRRVLQDMQRRMDARHLENERHPVLEEFKVSGWRMMGFMMRFMVRFMMRFMVRFMVRFE